MENVLIAGATGLTGQLVIDLLKKHADYTPIALVRDVEDQKKFQDQGVDARLGNLSGDLKGVVAGIDKVIFVAGAGSGSPESATIEVDQKGAIQLIKMSESANVSKFVMLSAYGADNPDGWPDEMLTYYRAKHEADKELMSAKLRFSVVRAGALTKHEGTGKISAAKNLSNSGEIARKDVAKVLVACLADEVATQMDFDLLSGNTEIEEALKAL